ncbi:hypothetical protein E3N88_34863 [Mikania micrantha]|uniref:Uncharacterized protein n=1 Tax=Mikania micrantha TaxID=192012 RepID=A0A5N6M209_9ASTR|nr:hypothetical protein E3N88_34863 [Mikania micrantha]
MLRMLFSALEDLNINNLDPHIMVPAYPVGRINNINPQENNIGFLTDGPNSTVEDVTDRRTISEPRVPFRRSSPIFEPRVRFRRPSSPIFEPRVRFRRPSSSIEDHHCAGTKGRDAGTKATVVAVVNREEAAAIVAVNREEAAAVEGEIAKGWLSAVEMVVVGSGALGCRRWSWGEGGDELRRGRRGWKSSRRAWSTSAPRRGRADLF